MIRVSNVEAFLVGFSSHQLHRAKLVSCMLLEVFIKNPVI